MLPYREVKGASGAWSRGRDSGRSRQGHRGCRAGQGTPGRRVQSQGPGPTLVKGTDEVGLGSETWTVTELRSKWDSVEKGSFALAVSGTASLLHIWTPPSRLGE